MDNALGCSQGLYVLYYLHISRMRCSCLTGCYFLLGLSPRVFKILLHLLYCGLRIFFCLGGVLVLLLASLECMLFIYSYLKRLESFTCRVFDLGFMLSRETFDFSPKISLLFFVSRRIDSCRRPVFSKKCKCGFVCYLGGHNQ